MSSFNPEDPVTAKVGDFGLSTPVPIALSDILATWQWLAPEVTEPNSRYRALHPKITPILCETSILFIFNDSLDSHFDPNPNPNLNPTPNSIPNPNFRYDERSDIYSFGVVVYEIMSRILPFTEFDEFLQKTEQPLTEEQLNNSELIRQLEGAGFEIRGTKAVREEVYLMPTFTLIPQSPPLLIF